MTATPTRQRNFHTDYTNARSYVVPGTSNFVAIRSSSFYLSPSFDFKTGSIQT